MTALTLEDAWREMADGLHIHRHFLSATHMQRARLHRCATSARQLKIIDRALRRGHIHELALIERALLANRLPRPRSQVTSQFGPMHIVVAQESSQKCARLVLPRNARDEIARTWATANVDFIVSLNTGMIVLISGEYPLEEAQLLHTVYVQQDDDPGVLSEEIAAASAKHWATCFFLARPTVHAYSRRVRVQWRATPVNALERVVDIFTTAVRWRVSRALASKGQKWRVRAARLSATLKTMEVDVETATTWLKGRSGGQRVDRHNELIVTDLLRTFVPGQRQFASYWNGGGAGQAE